MRLLTVTGAHNVRDLGGYPVRGGGETQWRRVFRSAGLSQLDRDGIEVLRGHRVTTLVDLRTPIEVEEQPNVFGPDDGITSHNVSLFGALAPIHTLTADGQPFDMPARYCQALDLCQDRIRTVLAAIADAPEGAVIFHCTAGKDRTGVIAALLLENAGVERDAVIEDYAITAELAKPMLALMRERALARGTAPATVEQVLATKPETMAAVLDHLDTAHGGIAAYLPAIGLSEAQIGRLRARLV